MQIPHLPTQRRAFHRVFVTLGITLVMVILAGGCGPADPPVAPLPVHDIHNPALGVTIAGLPAEWTVTTNRDQQLELKPSDVARPGLVSVSVGPEERGVNLVAAVDATRSRSRVAREASTWGPRSWRGLSG